MRPRDHPNIVARRRYGRATDTTCWLCHTTIDHTIRWPHPLSHSVDHIVPLARGGTNDPHNLTDAHLTCNTSRQAGRTEHHTSRPW